MEKKRFAPDIAVEEDDTPTLELPNFLKRAQFLLHILCEPTDSKDYVEKLEIVETALREIYQEASAFTRLHHDGKVRALQERLNRTTQRPPE